MRTITSKVNVYLRGDIPFIKNGLTGR